MLPSVARACAFTAAVVCVAGTRTAPLASFDAALDRYSRGEFDPAVRSVQTNGMKVVDLTSGLESWIASSDPPARPRRQMIAAAFALEVTWLATRNLNNAIDLVLDPSKAIVKYPERSSVAVHQGEFRVTVWAGGLVPASGPPTTAERWWRLAAAGILEDSYAWRQLLDPTGLPRAQARFPDEPRWRMADAIARTSRDVGALRPMGDRPDLLHDDTLGSAVTGHIPRAVHDFEAIQDDASLAGEAELHIGYLELKRREWDRALAHCLRARQLTTEPFLLAVADYFSGWIHEQRGRAADAVTAYRRANALAPGMRDLSTLLAAQLFVTHERAEAYAVLDAAYQTDPAAYDLLTSFERGDARFVPERLAKMREALR